MKKVKIRMNSLYDITEFVRKANSVNGDITIYKGNATIDGASFMGVASIDMRDGAYIEYPEKAYQFDEYISQFIVD